MNAPQTLNELTAAQRAAVLVLKQADKAVRGGNRASRMTPMPRVNTRAADSLVRFGYATASLLPNASDLTTGFEYRLSPAGEQLTANASDRSPQTRTYQRVSNGLYEHVSGALIVRTDEWEGPRGGSLSRWEIGHRDQAGELCVGADARFFNRLSDAVAALDRETA